VKYLGLLGLNNIMSVYPKIVSDMKEIIIECLDDEDITIRYRALDLICGVVSKKNMKGIIQKLIKICKTSDGQYRNVLIEKIITTCAKNTYEFIPSFQWYITILTDLTQLKGLENGELIASQLKNTVIRVKSIRAFAIEQLLELLNSKRIHEENLETSSLLYVIDSAIWIIGEFVSESTIELDIILKSILSSDIQAFPTYLQSSFIQTIMKIYAASAVSSKPSMMEGTNSDLKSLSGMRDEIRTGIDEFLKSSDVEVQERATTCAKLLQIHEEFLENGIDIGAQIKSLFSEELNPVAPGSQKKVQLPEGLDLDVWINNSSEFDDSDVEEEHEEKSSKQSKQEISTYSEAAKVFKLGAKKKTSKMDPTIPTHDINEIISVSKKKVKKGEKGEKKVKGEKKKKPKQEFVDEKVEISQGFDKPEGYVEPIQEKKSKNYKDQLASIDLTIPSEVVLPTTKEYKKITSEEILAQEKQKKELKKEAKEPTTKKKKKREAEIEAPVKDLLSFEEPKKETKKESKKESQTVVVPTSTKQKRKKLCHDDNIKVSYSKAVPVNANQIDIPLHIENTSSFDISAIEYNIQAPMNMKVIGGEGNIATNLKLPKSLSGDIQLSIGFKSIKKSASLNGVLTYKTNVNNF
jgi:AP-3 complex subunit delta